MTHCPPFELAVWSCFVLRMTQIPVPGYAPDYARGAIQFYDGFTLTNYEALQECRDRMLSQLHEAVESYVASHAFLDSSEDCFPQLRWLNGEYYIGSEEYHLTDL